MSEFRYCPQHDAHYFAWALETIYRDWLADLALDAVAASLDII